MWKKEDAKPNSATEITPVPLTPPPAHSSSASNIPAISSLPVSPRASACISQGIKIKGEVTGSEDLFVDGQVEGRLSLANGSLTIGPNGNVKADVSAREVIVRGNLEGKVSGKDKVQLWSTAKVTGEVTTERLAIEEGALLRGKVEAGKLTTKAPEAKAAAASAAKSGDSLAMGSGTAAD